MTVLLECSALTVRRGRRTVLAGVDLDLRAGEAVHLAGPNGSGKTSLLRALAGLAAPRGGRVRRHGVCAFLPERIALAPALRCGEWLRAMRGLRGLQPTDWRAAVTAGGLDEAVLDRPAETLSKGTLQRVALVEAIHSGCPLLLLDEPFACVRDDRVVHRRRVADGARVAIDLHERRPREPGAVRHREAVEVRADHQDEVGLAEDLAREVVREAGRDPEVERLAPEPALRPQRGDEDRGAPAPRARAATGLSSTPAAPAPSARRAGRSTRSARARGGRDGMPRRRPCRGCPRDRRRGRRRRWRVGTAPAPCPARGRGSPAAPRRARAARLRGRGGRDLEVRAALESLAARHAAARATPADVRELRALLRDMGARRERGDLMAVSETNARLHRRILEISGQATARRLSGMLISQIVRFQYRTVLLPGRPERSHREHTAIVDAIAAGDGDAAERATRRHLDHVARALHARVSAAAQPAPASAAGRRRRS